MVGVTGEDEALHGFVREHQRVLSGALEEVTRNDRRNMFRWNSGKKGRTFPDYNPYTISRCRDCDMNSGKGRLAFVPENEVCEACRVIHQIKKE